MKIKNEKILEQNALKNATKGLDVKKVIDIIKKIDKMKNPKTSYLIGKDPFISNIMAKLPQDFSNKLIKHAMKYRM